MVKTILSTIFFIAGAIILVFWAISYFQSSNQHATAIEYSPITQGLSSYQRVYYLDTYKIKFKDSEDSIELIYQGESFDLGRSNMIIDNFFKGWSLSEGGEFVVPNDCLYLRIVTNISELLPDTESLTGTITDLECLRNLPEVPTTSNLLYD